MTEKRKREDKDAKKSSLQLAIDNNPCALCRGKFPICMGHAKTAGGSSGGGEDESKSLSKDAAAELASKFLDKDKRILEIKTPELKLTFNNLYGEMNLRGRSELTEKQLEFLQRYLTLVNKTFLAFKKELAEQGISTKNFVHQFSDDKTKLLIKIPDPTHYTAFVRRLAEKGLLPSPYMALKIRDEAEQHANKRLKVETPRLVPKGHLE